MTLVKEAISQDHIDFCLVRNTQANINAGGSLFDLNLLATNFAGSGLGTFNISNIKAVDYNGATLSVGSYTTQVNFMTSAGIQNTAVAALKIMPNPATDKIIIDGLIDSKVSFEIMNVIGQPVMKANLDGKKSVDVSSLEKGAYFLKLNTQQGPVIKKFIKE